MIKNYLKNHKNHNNQRKSAILTIKNKNLNTMRGIITIAALILLLNGLTGTSQNKSTGYDSTYIPLLADTNVWYIADVGEFGELDVTDVGTVGYLNINDTIYRRIGPAWNSIWINLREDTLERKVYNRGGSLSNEELYYDFTMEEGDSMKGLSYGGGNIWFIVDSVRYINTLGGIRKAWYFRDELDHTYPVWIEGVGSLGGIDRNFIEPRLFWMFGELNCCYYNEKLVYRSVLATQYGCSFEHMNTTEILKDKGIQIFPNPVTNISRIKFENPENKIYQLFIYNVLGKLSCGKLTSSDIFYIKKQDFANGIYFYQLLNENNRIVQQDKFIIN